MPIIPEWIPTSAAPGSLDPSDPFKHFQAVNVLVLRRHRQGLIDPAQWPPHTAPKLLFLFNNPTGTFTAIPLVEPALAFIIPRSPLR